MGKQRKKEQGLKRSKKKEKGKGWAEEKTPILNRKCAKRKQQIKKIRCPKCSDKIDETDLSEHLLTSHDQEEKWAAIEESPEVGPSKVQSSPEEHDENETTSTEG